MKQPLLIVAVLYLGGILLGDQFQLPPDLMLGLSLMVAIAAMLWKARRIHLAGALLVLAGWTNFVCHTAIISPRDLRVVMGPQPELVTLHGTLTASPTQRIFEKGTEELWRSSALVKVEGFERGTNWVPAFGKVIVTTPGLLASNVFAGQSVVVNGILRQVEGPIAEGLFDARTFYRRKGIYFQLQAAADKDWQVLSDRSPPLADRFRDWAKKTLARGLPEEDEALRLTWTLMLDWKAPMTEVMEEPFVKAGTYHIFAVDGLRIGMIAAICLGLFRACRLRREYCGLVIIPLLWFYTGLTGWPASAVRASVMMSVVIFGWAAHRPSNLLNSLFAAAFIVLLWDPQQLFQAGFQMSFFVVACIGLLLPMFEKWFVESPFATDPYLPEALKPRLPHWLEKSIRGLLATFAMSLAAWLGSIPLCAYYFNVFTPLSLPANVAVVPMTMLAVSSGMASLMFGAWLPCVSEMFNNATWFWMKCIIVASRWFGNWAPGSWYVSAPSLVTIALYYFPLLALLTGWIFRAKYKGTIWAGIGILVMLWVGQEQTEKQIARVYLLPLRGASAVFAPAHGTARNWLMDCGDAAAANRVVKPFLHAHGFNHLENLCLTVGHQKHVDGADCILTNFSVDHVYTSAAHGRSPAWRRILSELEHSKHWEKLADGDTIQGWQVLHPETLEDYGQADDKALVLRREVSGCSMLFLSDLGRLGQKALVERHPDLRADIVIAGLPVKDEPLGDALLDLVRPKLIIVVDSEFPAIRRAPLKLRERLAGQKVPVIYCHETGALTWQSRKGGWEILDASGTMLFQDRTLSK